MDNDAWRQETTKCHCFFDPQNDVVARPLLVIAEIVIETQFLDRAGLQ